MVTLLGQTFATRALVIAILSMLGVQSVALPHSSNERLHETSDIMTFETADYRIQVTTIIDGLERPWSMAFLPNGDLLVTERPGRLRVVQNGRRDAIRVEVVPGIHAEEQDGLLDVALHPKFAENAFLYLSYAKPGPNGVTLALARARYSGDALRDVHDIFVADAWHQNHVNLGGKLAFSPDGHLFMTVGDRDQRLRAQSLADHAGAVLRLRDDGSVPADNPFVGRANAKPEIFTYGHRNAQGLVVEPAAGTIWEHEHGPQGGDELNRLIPGANYGWPTVTYGREYTGETISDRPWREDMEQPVIFWSPSIGVSGMTLYTGRVFPAWKDSLLVGALAGRQLQRIVFSGRGPVDREPILWQLGQRIRDVRQGPDECVYVLIDGDNGAVLRLEAVEWD